MEDILKNSDIPKVYVAAPSADIETVVRIYDILTINGYDISWKWAKLNNLKEKELTDEQKAQIALQDAEGVLNCNIFILIRNSSHKARGANVEYGMALAKRYLQEHNGFARIYIVGSSKDDNVFYYHPNVKKISTIDELFRRIKINSL